MNMNKKKFIVEIAVILFISSVLSGCSSYSKDSSAQIKQSDRVREVKTLNVAEYSVLGHSIQRFEKNPQRVIADGLGETEMVLAFADPETILAVYGFYNLHDFVKPQFKEKLNKLHILKQGETNKELILSLQPDLIIAEQCSFVTKSLGTTEFWNKRGIKTYVPANTNSPGKHIVKESIEIEKQYIRDFGIIFGKEKLADMYVKDIEQTLQFFQKRAKNGSKQRVMVVENFGKTIASYDKTKLVGDMVLKLGGTIPETQPILGEEDFLQENPDIIFVVCSDGDRGKCMEFFLRKPQFRTINAIKRKKVYSIELESMYGAGLRVKDGLERIGLALYPEFEEEYRSTQNNTINPSYIDWLDYKSAADIE